MTMNTEAQRISDGFEESFLSVSLEDQIAHCDHYELAPLFRQVIPDHQPMLEAGCGSGRWVAWSVNHGWESIGIDWSEALCEQARESIPGGTFYAADMRNTPLPGQSVGCILSLGAIEHASEGPDDSLKEYFRLLKPGGLAIITVPYLNPVRRLMRALKVPVRALKETLQGDRESSASRRAVYDAAQDGWAIDFLRDGNQWSFFQYLFTPRQILPRIEAQGFIIDKQYADFKDEGILHSYGRWTGSYDFAGSRVRLNPLGSLLKALTPTSWTGHMYCILARRPDSD